MADIQIVTLAPEDWQRYREIRLEALRTEPQAFSARYADNAAQPGSFWEGRLREAKSIWLFAQENDGRLVGMIGAFWPDEEGVARIVGVYVSPDRRGQGIGDALMSAILAAIRARGSFHTVALGVNSDQRAALALYQRFGFAITAEQAEVQGDGKTYLGYAMQRPLS